MAQKQIAPMTTIIKTPIKTEIIDVPFRLARQDRQMMLLTSRSG
jgi:hypothetical protein